MANPAPTTRRPAYWSEACAELSARDLTLATLIRGYRQSELRYRSDPFVTLARAIVAQQISVKAAESIWNRLVDATGGIEAAVFAKARMSRLRGCGLSERKAEYLRDLGRQFARQAIVPERWHEMDDESVIDDLSQLRGIGRWTAEMYLIFNLQRPDVFPIADLGLVRAISRHYNNDKPIGPRKLKQLDKLWRPWRTVATWYLWRSLDPIPVEY
jgi:DNA-3-methyladenine glycosylase II